MTKQGYKAIEEIKKGDQVLSFNSNLGLYDYKDVVDVYVNETSELCHLKTKNDEIICTPNHSILTEKGWMLACDIKTGDNIKTKDGLTAVVSTQIETLLEKIKVYNFNVLGYHTYVIGSELAIVHNDCVNEDYFRGGDNFTAKMSDVKMTNSGMVKPTHGISINSQIDELSRFSKISKIDSFPDSLQIIQRGLNPNHFEIVPKALMSFFKYQQELTKIIFHIVS